MNLIRVWDMVMNLPSQVQLQTTSGNIQQRQYWQDLSTMRGQDKKFRDKNELANWLRGRGVDEDDDDDDAVDNFVISTGFQGAIVVAREQYDESNNSQHYVLNLC